MAAKHNKNHQRKLDPASLFLLSCIQVESGVFLFGLHQQGCDSAYRAEYPINSLSPPPPLLPLAPHLSTMLGSAFLDSRSSTQRAILSSFAAAVVLAMSTVQWSVYKNTLVCERTLHNYKARFYLRLRSVQPWVQKQVFQGTVIITC